jgi:phosphoribosylaminoimidazolecarboxamide formyltransferase/IMP cyclohydrolase
LADAIENIDIGGPTMLRASAKNFQDVTVIVDPTDYPQVLKEIKETGNTTLKTRFRLAAKVFALTAKYDTTISAWLDKVVVDSNPYFADAK